MKKFFVILFLGCILLQYQNVYAENKGWTNVSSMGFQYDLWQENSVIDSKKELENAIQHFIFQQHTNFDIVIKKSLKIEEIKSIFSDYMNHLWFSNVDVRMSDLNDNYYRLECNVTYDDWIVLYLHYVYGTPVKEEYNKVLNIIDTFIKEHIKPSMSDTEKERIVHDWLAERIVYSTDITDNTRSVYDAMVYQKAVCKGYTESFHVIMAAMGIPSEIVYGRNKENDVLHCWNAVYHNGIWKYIDVTQDDIVYDISYDNFLIDENIVSNQFLWDY